MEWVGDGSVLSFTSAFMTRSAFLQNFIVCHIDYEKFDNQYSQLQVSETPYWLALVGERDKAQELFARLRAGTEFKTEGEATLNLAELDAEDKQYGLLRLLADADFVEPLALILCMNLATESACQLVFAALNTPNEYFKYETLLRDLSDQIPRAVVLWVPIVATLLMPLVVRFVGRRYIYFGTLVISYGLLVGYMLSKNQENVRPWMEYSCFLALHLGGRQVALILPTEVSTTARQGCSLTNR